MNEKAPLVLTEKELAEHLGLSIWTCRRMRLQEGCPYIPVGNRILYRLESVMSWMSEKERGTQKLEPEYGKIRRIR